MSLGYVSRSSLIRSSHIRYSFVAFKQAMHSARNTDRRPEASTINNDYRKTRLGLGNGGLYGIILQHRQPDPQWQIITLRRPAGRILTVKETLSLFPRPV